MSWYRVRVADKAAFREDLQVDPTLTDLQKRLISVIAQHWDNGRMHAECSGSFIAVGAGTTEKMVKRYKQSLIDSGRVKVKRAATYTTSTLWDVNWWFRGGAYARLMNGGEPISDCRKVVPKSSHGGSPGLREGEVPDNAQREVPKRAGGGPQTGTQFPSNEGDIAGPFGSAARLAPSGAGSHAGPAFEKEEAGSPHGVEAGFAKWRIVHAAYEGEDRDVFVAHLRSGKERKFVLRLPIDSEEYDELDRTLDIDGEADAIVGELIAISTNRTGAKAFRRAAPRPWQSATILSGEAKEDGGAVIRLRFLDGREANMPLSADEAGSLSDVFGGEEEALGRRISWRLLPDDRMEFRPIGEAA